MKPLTYSKREWLIMWLLMPPISIILNYSLFGGQYFVNWRVFLLASFPTFLLLILVYISCGMIATVLLNRFPRYQDTFKRIGMGLLAYMLIMVAAITIIYLGYDYVGFLGYEIDWRNYVQALLVGILCNLLATSFNEGASFYYKWRTMA